MRRAISILKSAQWCLLMLFSAPHFTQSSYIHGQTHWAVVWGITACYLVVQQRCAAYGSFKDHLSTYGCLTSLRKKLQQTQPEDSHQFLPEWLVNVYSYCVMVTKSVSCCCVHGSRVYSNPVTRNTSIPALFHVMIQFIFKPTIEVDWLKAPSKQFGVMSLLWCILNPTCTGWKPTILPTAYVSFLSKMVECSLIHLMELGHHEYWTHG